MNQITIVGNVGSDPEILTSTNGIKTAKYSIAVTKKTKDEKKTTWFRIIQFRYSAEFAENYIKKGMKILIVGEIEIDEYTDKNGIKQKSIQIIGEKCEIMSSLERDSNRESESQSNKNEPETIQKPQSFLESIESESGDLPF
jgi:single-strand DNA-binding protein